MSVSRDHYYKLASEVHQERIEAATKLLSELGEVDKTEEWDYALKRLIKGLTTSRQSARYGFSMALTELVRELVTKSDYDLSVSSYLDRVVEASPVSKSMKGKEVRSTLFGRLFGFQALVNSQLLLDQDASSQQTLQKFVKLIVELAGTKPWLRETAMFTLYQFFGAYLQSSFAEDETTVAFLQIISDEGLTFTTEGLAMVLALPKGSRARLCLAVSTTKMWKHGDPMARGNMPVLAQVLRDVDAVDEAETEDKPAEKTADKPVKTGKQKNTWSPRLPFVWDLIVAHFVGDDIGDDSEEVAEGSKKRKKSASSASKKKAKTDSAVEFIPFREFWKVAVDDTLFAEKSSAERKFWGFEIFTKFLATLPGPMVVHIFTPNLMRSLMNHSSKTDRLLHKIATKTIQKVIETSQNDLAKVVPCLQAISDETRGGGWKFDVLSKSKLVDSLVGVLGHLSQPENVPHATVEKLVREITDLLMAKFSSGLQLQHEIEKSSPEDASKKKSNDNMLKWVLDKLLLLFRSSKRYAVALTGPKEDVFKFLLQHAFFSTKNSTNVSSNVLKLVQERLSSFLSEFIAEKRKDHSWSLYCVKQIEKMETRDEYELLLELSDELVAIKKECFDMLSTIKQAMKKSPSAKGDQYCFELLFSMNLLQLYMGETETVGVLEDLKISYVDIFGNVDEGIDTSVVLTEILLSFVSRQSTLLKKLSSIVWESYMCAENSDGKLKLNADCFKLLFDVLASRENEEGQQKLFEGEAEYEGEESEGSDSESDNDSESSEIAESETPDGKKSVEMVEQETTIKLAKALGIKEEYNGEVKFEDLDSEGDDQYESESMDDEQMMAIDGELARIFKERRNALTDNSTSKKNSEKAQAKQQMLLFKNRVLDLMESFSKVQPNSVYNISFLRPIVSLMNTTKDKNLGVKAHKLLKGRVSKVRCTEDEIRKVYSTEEEVAAFKNSVMELITWLQVQAGTSSSNLAHGAACGQCCIIASKCLLAIDPACLSEIVQIYGSTLTKWASEPKNRIQAGMFFDFINWLATKRGK